MKGLVDFLIDTGLLSRRSIEEAQVLADERGEPLQDTLLRAGFVTEDGMRRAVSHALGIPFITLTLRTVPIETFLILPEAMSRVHKAIAYNKTPQGIEIAFLRVEDIAPVREYLGPTITVIPRLTDTESMTVLLLNYQKLLKEQFGLVLSEEMARIQAAFAQGDAADTPTIIDAGTRATDALLQHALYAGAQDVAFEPRQSLVVRYRLGSAWYDAMTLPLAAFAPIAARLKELASLVQPSSTSGRFRFFAGQEKTLGSVVVSVYASPVVHEQGIGEKVSLSLIHDDRPGFSLSWLGMTHRNQRLLRDACTKQGGLVLACGPAGAGKTTLLYALLGELTNGHVSAGTVEAYIGTLLPGVSQMELRDEIGLNAVACLRTHLRHGAQVIMLDCPLDEELLDVAAEAANRGHTILMSVDADSAADGIARVRYHGMGPAILASILVASVGVGVVPRLCPQSRRLGKPTRDQQRYLEDTLDVKQALIELREEQIVPQGVAWKDMPLYEAWSCEVCEDGYSGNVGLQEIILPSRMLKDAIRNDADVVAFIGQTHTDGTLGIPEDALIKAAQGLLSVDEVVAVAQAQRGAVS